MLLKPQDTDQRDGPGDQERAGCSAEAREPVELAEAQEPDEPTEA